MTEDRACIRYYTRNSYGGIKMQVKWIARTQFQRRYSKEKPQ